MSAANSAVGLLSRAACFREDIGMRAGRCADGRVAVIRHYNDYTRQPFATRHAPLTPVSMRSDCCCNGTKSIGSSDAEERLSGSVDFIIQQRRNVVTFPRLCRDRIELRYFLTQRQECIGLAGGPETHTHMHRPKRRLRNVPLLKPSILSLPVQSFFCCFIHQFLHPLIWCPDICVDSVLGAVGAQQRLGGIGCQRDKARLSKLRPGATRNLA